MPEAPVSGVFVSGQTKAHVTASRESPRLHWLRRFFMFIAIVRKIGLIAVLAGAGVTCTCPYAQAPFGTPNENSAFSIPEAQQMQPAALSKLLSAKNADKPLVLQVGSRVLFDQAHIAGSEYAG